MKKEANEIAPSALEKMKVYLHTNLSFVVASAVVQIARERLN